MIPDRKEITLLDRLEKHATTKAEAKRVYNLIKNEPFMEMTVHQLSVIKGMGRKALLLVMEVAADLAGKK